MSERNLIGQRVTIFLKNGFKFCGDLLDSDDFFFYLLDTKSGLETISKTSVERISYDGVKK